MRLHAARDGEGREFLRPLILDGAWSKAMEAVTSGVVLAALALYLGADPFLIGLIGASPFFAQLSQFAGLRLVFRVRDRRKVSLAAAFISRILIACVGIIALSGPSPWALPALVAILAASGCLAAVSAVSWAFWMRDLIPQHVYGDRFSRRFAMQALVSVAMTLTAGIGLSYAAGTAGIGLGLALLFFAGAAFGMVSLAYAARLPEVDLNPADAAPSIAGLVRAVMGERDRRDTTLFLLAWTIAAFLGMPFVTVFLLREAGLGFGIVSTLTAVAMAASFLTFRFWGRSVDRFGTRAVLALAIPSAAFAMLVLPVAAGVGSWRLALLSAVFVVSGSAFAAIDVAVAKLVARQAPFTGAGTFLAGAGIARALAAGTATILGGVAAGAVAGRDLGIEISLGEQSSRATISGYAFLFLGSALLMLYAWHRVLALRVGGQGEVRDVLHEAQVELAGLAPFRGVRVVGHLAGHVTSHVLERRYRAREAIQRAIAGPSVRSRISR